MVIADNLKFLLLGPFPGGQIGGLLLTIVLSGIIGVGGLAFGILVAAARLASSPIVRGTADALATTIRCLPSLVFLFWLYFLLPALLNVPLTPLQSAAIALSIYQGAFIAEDIRGGLRAVGRGQLEAGYATGLSPFQVFIHVTIPQAVRAVVPALVNRYINMVLYTSVASVVGVLEFARASILVSNRLMVHPLEIFGFAALVYFLVCRMIALLGHRLERRWNWAPKIAQSAAV
jgi:polar amino acid transport system permease protein